MEATDNPVLSVVVAIVSDTTRRADASHLGPCLEALLRQTGAPPLEIVVPHHPSLEGIAEVQRQYPSVRFLRCGDLRTYTGRPGSREHHDELRARGLAAARGSIVALIEDHGVVAPDWAARLIEGFAGPYAGLGGAIENGVDRPLNWAVYFCDFLRYQNPLPQSETTTVSDANVAYRRTALDSVQPIWEEIFHEASVNGALQVRGEKLAFAPRAVLYQRRQALRLGPALKERFVWGRSYGATRARLAGGARRLFWCAFAPGLPVLMMARMGASAWRKRRTCWRERSWARIWSARPRAS